jgi:hypothetical protein
MNSMQNIMQVSDDFIIWKPFFAVENESVQKVFQQCEKEHS